MWNRTEAKGYRNRPLFPRIAARDIIASLKLIDGDAVWGDQRKIELPTSGCRNGVASAPLDLKQPCLKKVKGGFPKMRTILTKGLIALAITTVAALGADNTIGTWKLNVAKSTYTPAPMPVKSLTITREASDGGVKVTTTGERTNGPINATYMAKYDGTEVKVTGSNLTYDTIAIKQVNANTLTDERKKTGGSYKVTGRTVVSNGGKTMTTTTKGTNADGKDFTSVLVFDKQ